MISKIPKIILKQISQKVLINVIVTMSSISDTCGLCLNMSDSPQQDCQQPVPDGQTDTQHETVPSNCSLPHIMSGPCGSVQ